MALCTNQHNAVSLAPPVMGLLDGRPFHDGYLTSVGVSVPKRVVSALLVILVLIPCLALAQSDVGLHGYFRNHGTYVKGHRRLTFDGNPYNNHSFSGNYYNPDTYLGRYCGRTSWEFPVFVRRYTRHSRYVAPHFHRALGANPYNNYSYPGNYKPNTELLSLLDGSLGTKIREQQRRQAETRQWAWRKLQQAFEKYEVREGAKKHEWSYRLKSWFSNEGETTSSSKTSLSTKIARQRSVTRPKSSRARRPDSTRRRNAAVTARLAAMRVSAGRPVHVVAGSRYYHLVSSCPQLQQRLLAGAKVTSARVSELSSIGSPCPSCNH